jgi:hypothetical protein
MYFQPAGLMAAVKDTHGSDPLWNPFEQCFLSSVLSNIKRETSGRHAGRAREVLEVLEDHTGDTS